MEAAIVFTVVLAMICYMEEMMVMSFTVSLVMTPYTAEQVTILSMEMELQPTD